MSKRSTPRPTSVEKAIGLLSSVKVTIQKHGRPRRRPNIAERPTAVSTTGKKVSPVSPGASKWSLVGAFRADAEAIGVTKSIIELAAAQFVKAYTAKRRVPSKANPSLEDIDVYEFDDREVERALQRAIRNMQRGTFA